MTITVTPTQSNIFTALSSFLQSVLPAGVGIYQAQINRVAEPKGSDFVLMTAIGRWRLATNEDTYEDCAFTGSITGTVLTVTSIQIGPPQGIPITPGNLLLGPVARNTIIGTQLTGTTGGTGTYNVSVSQTVSSGTLAAGAAAKLTETQVTIQLDVHGPNSAENAQLISTLFRDEYATTQFTNQNPNYGVVPLYADDPRQMPFWNDQSQIETRWIVMAEMQADQTVTGIPQDFADALVVGLIDVDVAYPA